MNLDLSDLSGEAREFTSGCDARCMISETFEIYVDDDRYSVPTLHLVAANGSATAHAHAQRLMDDSPHHLGAEICLRGERIAGLGSFSQRSLPPGVAFRKPDIIE